MNGKRDGFERGDFDAFAETTSLSRSRARDILDEVIATVANWPSYADEAKVGDHWAPQIQASLRLFGR